jgi:hypothetical protein
VMPFIKKMPAIKHFEVVLMLKPVKSPITYVSTTDTAVMASIEHAASGDKF